MYSIIKYKGLPRSSYCYGLVKPYGKDGSTFIIERCWLQDSTSVKYSNIVFRNMDHVLLSNGDFEIIYQNDTYEQALKYFNELGVLLNV